MVKQEERRAATRDAVLLAAKDSFGAGGYGPTSVDEIAAKAGVAKGAVYHHFPTKAALFEAVVEGVAAGLMGDVILATSGQTAFLPAINAGNAAFFNSCADSVTARIYLHDGPAVLGWAKWRAIDERNFGGLLRLAFATAIASGIRFAHDPERMTKIVLAAVTESVIDAAEGDNFEQEAAAYLKIISAMIAGWVVEG